MSSDPRIAAGEAAERQMEHYLRREFTDNDPVRIIHDLRILDPTITEANGDPAVAQIDHLVIHKFGAFIVESKSVSTTVRIRDDGSGGDEWERYWNRHWEGMPSPIRQAERQGETLRNLLNANRVGLLQEWKGAMAVASKLLRGTVQPTFRNMPIQIVVAISDHGKIDRRQGWRPPSEPFRTFVSKADLVGSKIKEELSRHEQASRIIRGKPDGDYGIWRMDLGEVIAVTEFLESKNTSRSSSSVAAPPPSPKPEPAARKAEKPSKPVKPTGKQAAACQACGSNRLNAQSGPYGYYWKCADCSKNTPMAKACPACGAGSDRGKTVRVTKDGPTYTRTCSACGHAAVVWDTARDAG